MKSVNPTIGKLEHIIDLANEALKELKHPVLLKNINEKSRNPKRGPQFYICELIEEGFLRQGKSIETIRTKLEAEGQKYSQQDLGTPLRRLVQQKQLQRDKVGPKYVYTERK